MNRKWPLMALPRAASLASTRSFSSTSSPVATFPLKNVTESNFEASFEVLRSHVRAADFVAIDLEMTGITSAPWRDSFEFDRFDIRYLKIKDSAEKFAVVQFGVCPFRWESSKQSFIAHPHNFYVFPRHEHPVGDPSNGFLCQTSSLEFLAKYQFDFNACIHGGVSYLSRRQEDEALENIKLLYEHKFSESLRNLRQVSDIQLVRISDILFSNRMKNKITEWRDGLSREQNGRSLSQGSLNNSLQQVETVFFKMRPALSLSGFSPHQLRLIQLVTRKHFKDLVFVHADDEASCLQHLVVYTDSENDMHLLMKEVNDEHQRAAEMKIKAAVGFRHVIDLLSSEQKLIVGHNCFLDIAHIYSKFLGPLPSTAEEFVSSFNKHFPSIIDTKVLLNGNNILRNRMKKSSTSLSSAFASLCPEIALGSNTSLLPSEACVKVEVQVDDLRSSNWNSGTKHEAGYDAFMTGCIFAQSCKHLEIDFKLHLPSEDLAHNEKLGKHINHLYLSWTNGEIIDLRTGNKNAESTQFSTNLKKRYPNILFENIVLVWGFPSKLKAREIRECICKVFGPTSVAFIFHLDETAVFIQFNKAELVSDFLVLKETLEKNNDPISVLHPFSKLLEGGSTCASSYEIYKDICGSPIAKVSFADQAEAVGIKWKTKLMESKILGVEIGRHEYSSKNCTEKGAAAHHTEKSNISNTLLSGKFSSDKVIESFYATDIKHAQTSSL